MPPSLWFASHRVHWLSKEAACCPQSSGSPICPRNWIENFLGFGSGPAWVTGSFCVHHSGAGCCDRSSLEGQSRGAWVGDGSQGTRHWAGTTGAHSQKGAWPPACACFIQTAGGWRSGPLSSSETDKLPSLGSRRKWEGKGSAPTSEDANSSRGHAPDLVTSQKLRLLRHHLGPKVFNLEILRGGHPLRSDISSNAMWFPVL